VDFDSTINESSGVALSLVPDRDKGANSDWWACWDRTAF